MRIRGLLLIPVASVAIYACSDPDPAQSGLPSGYEDVLLEGLVTDEALVAFVQALEQGPPEDDPSQAATVDWPEDGAQLPRDMPSSFCWRFSGSAWLDRGAPIDRWAGLAPGPAASSASTLMSPLRELLGPPRRALAHGDPFSGIATYLVFSTSAEPRLLRALTGDDVFTPSKEAWDRMAATGEPITLRLVSAFFEQNRVTPDGGPFVGATMQFTIAP
jgi:hypothetical protein